jgi:hypothetical protein
VKIVFICSSLERGRDGVGDYTRRLAAECIRQGHECRLLALNEKRQTKAEIRKVEGRNEGPSGDDFIERQESERVEIECLRLPASLDWKQRFELLRRFLEWFSPDWISLQFVPFGFHPKGLCFGLGQRLSAIDTKASWQIMFHELWLGLGENSPVKYRFWGAMQRRIIRDLVRCLRPRVVHTHAEPYRQVLGREKIKAAILPLFSNIPLAKSNGWDGLLEPLVTKVVGTHQDRTKLYLAGVFGAIHPEWNVEETVNVLLPLVQRCRKRLVLVFHGKNNLTTEAFDKMESTLQDRATIIVIGEGTDVEISKLFQTLDLGLATSPRQLIQKSASVAAMLEHGLPVLVTRDDWRLRGADAQPEEKPSRLLSPKQFMSLKVLPTRNLQPSGDGSVKQVADRMLGAMKLSSNEIRVHDNFVESHFTSLINAMKTSIKNILEKYAPRLRYAITSYKSRHMFGKHYENLQNQIRKKIFSQDEPVVLSGPFAGMRYISEIVWGPITPKWLGAYECELHPIINKIISQAKYGTIINIGAAEGYYAVGLAKHLPRGTVFAFDLDFRARAQQRRLAKLNNVKNLMVGSRCNPIELQNRIKAHSCLIICDIEGFEVELLDPSKVPGLRNADIIVEVHPAQGMSTSAVGDLLKKRFHDSHDIETIDSCSREIAGFRKLVPLKVTDEELLMALEEGRCEQQYWLWMRHRQ